MSHSGWLSCLVRPDKLANAASILADEINADKANLNIKAIAVRGVSGYVIGGLISFLTDLPLIIIRKDNNSHSSYSVEYSGPKLDYLPECNYVIVDDLIDKGDTIRTIYEKASMNICNAKLVKVYLYASACATGITQFSLPFGVMIPVSNKEL